jgi:hypothetical protein
MRCAALSASVAAAIVCACDSPQVAENAPALDSALKNQTSEHTSEVQNLTQEKCDPHPFLTNPDVQITRFDEYTRQAYAEHLGQQSGGNSQSSASVPLPVGGELISLGASGSQAYSDILRRQTNWELTSESRSFLLRRLLSDNHSRMYQACLEQNVPVRLIMKSGRPEDSRTFTIGLDGRWTGRPTLELRIVNGIFEQNRSNVLQLSLPANSSPTFAVVNRNTAQSTEIIANLIHRDYRYGDAISIPSAMPRVNITRLSRHSAEHNGVPNHVDTRARSPTSQEFCTPTAHANSFYVLESAAWVDLRRTPSNDANTRAEIISRQPDRVCGRLWANRTPQHPNAAISGVIRATQLSVTPIAGHDRP